MAAATLSHWVCAAAMVYSVTLTSMQCFSNILELCSVRLWHVFRYRFANIIMQRVYAKTEVTLLWLPASRHYPGVGRVKVSMLSTKQPCTVHSYIPPTHPSPPHPHNSKVYGFSFELLAIWRVNVLLLAGVSHCIYTTYSMYSLKQLILKLCSYGNPAFWFHLVFSFTLQAVLGLSVLTDFGQRAVHFDNHLFANHGLRGLRDKAFTCNNWLQYPVCSLGTYLQIGCLLIETRLL